MIQLTSPVKEELFSPLKNKTKSYHQWQAMKGRCRKTDTQSNNIFSLDGVLIRHFKPQCSLTNSPDWFPYFKNKWREFEKRSKHFSAGDHFFNSHIFFLLILHWHWDNGARKSNNWLDQWQNGKLGTGSRVSFSLLSSSTDVPVLLLNQPKRVRKRLTTPRPDCCLLHR